MQILSSITEMHFLFCVFVYSEEKSFSFYRSLNWGISEWEMLDWWLKLFRKNYICEYV